MLFAILSSVFCLMKSIILSIKPFFTEAILDGRKAIELRKRIGELFVENTKIFIYSSSPVKAIVAEAKISCIQKKAPSDVEIDLLEKACVDREYFDEYFKKSSMAYLIYLKEVKKLDIPIPIVKLRQLGITPPQSFCYVNDSILIKRN